MEDVTSVDSNAGKSIQKRHITILACVEIILTVKRTCRMIGVLAPAGRIYVVGGVIVLMDMMVAVSALSATLSIG